MSVVRQERKVVTVLFADLVGFTARSEQLDPEDVAAVLRPYHERLRSELVRFGGTVEKFIGDAVMALFGAPVAHEDDPERAVRAALAIRDWAREEESVQVRIAVNTGEALINLGARPESGEGMAAGDVVNTTARLQSAAPVNGVLVGESTFRATDHVIDYAPATAVAAKGKAEPLPVWEALEATARVGGETVSTRAPLVGRARELDQLTDALARAREERSPQLVTLVGVPGIGKSRLVFELLQVADADPEIVFWRHGRSLPYGEGVTFWALSEMVKAQAGILETDSAEEAAAKLSAAVADVVEEGERTWIEGKLRPLVGLGADSELGADRRSESFAAWRRFFESLADRRPLVLVFEDLHWADDDLLDFVDELPDWVEGVPLLVVATARPELLDRRPGWSGGKRNALTISLSPLGDNDTARLIADLLDRSVLPAETQTTLLERAGGNPLYAEQFVRMISERSDGEAELPETVQGIIAARLDLLSQDEKALLQDAAVLGKVFWPGALAAIGGVPDAHVEDQLRGLARKEFVRRERRASIAGETEYSFGHALVRDVAYNQIPRAARADKHRLAAEWIDSLARDRTDDRAEMLAHHYASALEFAAAAGMNTDTLALPARSALREGADRAYALGSYRQADRLYSAALELWPAGDPARSELSLGRAHVRNDYNQAVDPDELSATANSFLAAGRHDLAADAQMLLAKRAWNAGQGALAHDHVDRALALVRDAPPSPAKAAVLAESARLAMLAADRERAEVLGSEGLEIADTLGLDRLRASALITLGTLPGQDVSLLEQGLALALSLNDVQQIQRGYNNLGEELLRLGRIDEVGAVYDEQRRTTDRLGVVFIWQDAQEAAFYYMIGNWDRAERLTDSFLAVIDSGVSHYQEAGARMIRALIRYGRGDMERAFEEAERSTAAARAAGDPQMITWLARHAILLLGEGRTEEASALIDEVSETGFFDYYLVLEFGLAKAELGRAGELAGPLANADLGQGWLEGGRALSVGDFAAAATSFGSLGLATHEARARLLAASELVAAGRRREADEQLSRALAFYRSVRATRYIREGEALLAASA
jgi:class 3 adenylate cyclase/tetratricopeptide (TPR) repeat protein